MPWNADVGSFSRYHTRMVSPRCGWAGTSHDTFLGEVCAGASAVSITTNAGMQSAAHAENFGRRRFSGPPVKVVSGLFKTDSHGRTSKNIALRGFYKGQITALGAQTVDRVPPGRS